MEIKDVGNLAELARLELSGEEKEQILKDMESILEYVKVIQKVDIDDVSPEYNLKNVWREDLPASGGPDFSRELILKQFPDSQDDFLKVKKIL